jgi:hypothetical protein
MQQSEVGALAVPSDTSIALQHSQRQSILTILTKHLRRTRERNHVNVTL